jgi:glycosyltransferase A (GT-A) superfamily protein (DUF2064 family)
MNPPAIVLFARSPEREAAAKGMRSSAALFRAVVEKWLVAARVHGVVPVIACVAEDRASLAAIAPHVERLWIEQREQHFGARVAAAATDAFALGFVRVILAAIDAPPHRELGRALDALARGVSVIAPARDGGINLIGLTSPERALLERFSPRRRDLVRLCRAHFRELVVLDTTTDVDSPSALADARNERAWRGLLMPVPFTEQLTHVGSLLGVEPSLQSRPPPAMAGD